MDTYIIYSKRVALELRKLGFRLLGTGINENFPQFNTYIFENSSELQRALAQFTKRQ